MSFEQKGKEGRRVTAPVDPSSADLIYYGNRLCPYAHRAWWSILEKNITDMDYIHIDLRENKPEWYQAQVNPSGTVPFIYHKGRSVAESLIVAEYIDEAFKTGNSLMPSEPIERADVRFIIAYYSDKIAPVFFRALSNKDPQLDQDFQAQVFKATKDLNDKFAAKSKGPYFLGENLSLADIAIVPFLERYEVALKALLGLSIFDESSAGLKTLLDACRSRPAFQQSRGDDELYINAYSRYTRNWTQ
eukprot:TRINITY_DN11549_c0_g1_i1.p1 TRINITY_DN11549_c0_g1~~TRINITY_DN11549_c0_g1_i1.p1  ORF type:complete len:246 (-),score=111.25 TRINITY_DN11549_c0_g1_i1:84-821(-)